jgi:hypothetical protein
LNVVTNSFKVIFSLDDKVILSNFSSFSEVIINKGVIFVLATNRNDTF